MSDLINRQDAIRLAEQGQIQGFEWQFKKLCELSSAEPEERTEERTETHACDCISRQAAIELKPEFLNPNVNRETEE